MARSAILAAGFIDLTQNGVDYHQSECLLVEEGRIVGFDKPTNLPDGIAIIDRSSEYCLPGLVDTAFLAGLTVAEHGVRANSFGEYVWQAKRASEHWVTSGVTSVASMGAYDRMDIDLQASIIEGRLAGPQLYPALSPLVPAGAENFHWLYGVREVHGGNDARRAVRELIKQGAERIVLYADVPLEIHSDPHETNRHRLAFSLDELHEIVTQAKQAGCFVHAQAISSGAIDTCLQAGVRSIGCAFGLQESHIPIMVAKGIALAPNLALGGTIREFGPAAGFSPGVIQMVSQQRIAPDRLLLAQEAGVEIICGTNAAFLAGDVYRECLELERAGISPRAVLQAVTQSGAKALKPYLESGFFRPRYRADLLFVESDPLQKLEALSRIRAVMIKGTMQRSAAASALSAS